MTMTPKCDTSEVATVGVASVSFAMVLDNSYHYELTSTTACWFKQGDGAQTASAAAGSVYLPANASQSLHGARGTTIAVIQEAAGGKACLVRTERQ